MNEMKIVVFLASNIPISSITLHIFDTERIFNEWAAALHQVQIVENWKPNVKVESGHAWIRHNFKKNFAKYI